MRCHEVWREEEYHFALFFLLLFGKRYTNSGNILAWEKNLFFFFFLLYKCVILFHYIENTTLRYKFLKWQPTPVLLPGKSHGQRSLVDYSPWDCKESDMTERLHFTAFRTLVDHDGYSISSEGFLPTVAGIMVIWVKVAHSSPF